MDSILIKSGYEQMDVKAIHAYLSEYSYWAKGISFELVNQSLRHSFCVGIFINDRQIGFARLITDYTTFAWLADVYVLEEFRGQGLSKSMMQFMMQESWVQRLRRLMLNTRDAHGLYRQFGFGDLSNPAFIQELYRPNAHLNKES